MAVVVVFGACCGRLVENTGHGCDKGQDAYFMVGLCLSCASFLVVSFIGEC